MRTSLVAALVALAVGADTAAAQEVTGLDVRQGDGFATLSWAPVAGATSTTSNARRWAPTTWRRAHRRSSASGGRTGR